MFREAFCAVPTCSGSRAALLTGQYGHNNGMLGLAHRGWVLNDYGEHIVHTLREAGYWSAMIGEQHIAKRPDVIGYDQVVKVETTRVESVAPIAIDLIASGPQQPWFFSVGFFETHREFFAPSSVGDVHVLAAAGEHPGPPDTRRDMASYKASARSLDHGVGAVLAGARPAQARRRHAGDLHHRPRARVPGRQGDAVRPRDRRHADHARARRVRRRPRDRRARLAPGHLPHAVRPRRHRAAGVPPGRVAAAAGQPARGRGPRPPVRGGARSTPPTSRSARCARSATSTSGASATARCRCWRTRTTARARTCCCARGWGERPIPFEQLYDLSLDPNEASNLFDDPAYARRAAGPRRAARALDARDRRPAARRAGARPRPAPRSTRRTSGRRPSQR